MFLACFTFIIGLIALVVSAQKLVQFATNIGLYHQLSEFIIGITIIGVGTSLPEIIVSVLAAYNGTPDLAIGNGYGSNLANILLVLGTSLVICQIKIPKTLWRGELSQLLIVTSCTFLVLLTGFLDRLYGVAALLVYGLILLRLMLKTPKNKKQKKPVIQTSYFLTWLFLGLSFGILMVSADALVWSATLLAHQLNVGDEIIGLTIVAIGTSLPELATSIAACQQNKPDLILGNVIGSNLLNTLVVIGAAAIITPIHVDFSIIYRDFALMFLATIYLWFRCFSQKPKVFTRLEGMMLLGIYVIYLMYLANHVLQYQ